MQSLAKLAQKWALLTAVSEQATFASSLGKRKREKFGTCAANTMLKKRWRWDLSTVSSLMKNSKKQLSNGAKRFYSTLPWPSAASNLHLMPIVMDNQGSKSSPVMRHCSTTCLKKRKKVIAHF